MRGEQDGDRLPKWLRATLGTVGDVVLFAALSLVIWTILPAVALGATPVIIGGGSMAPQIRVGDVVLLDDTAPPEGEMFAPGTVLTFETVDLDGAPTGELVTHRVASLAEGQYVTRGDANASDDTRPVHPDQLVGVGRWLVPAIGLPVHWARTGSWHLVALTALAGMAAAAASMASRRRVVIEVPDEAVEDTPIELPEVVPSGEGVPEPVAAMADVEPILAFDLDDEEQRIGADDGEREVLDPAAAERAATIAARAARRGLAGLDRVREERDQDADEREVASSDRPTDGSAGSAPIAAVLTLALALLAATLAPAFASAAFVTTTGNTGNSFSVAPAADLSVDVDIYDDWVTGYCANVTVSTTSTTPIAWEVELDLSTSPLNGTPTSVSNATYTWASPVLTASGAGWNDTVVAGNPRVWQFCAARASTTFALTPPAGAPHSPPDGVIIPPDNSTTTYDWRFTVPETLNIHGPVHLDIRLRSSLFPQGPSNRHLVVSLYVDGQHLVTSGETTFPHSTNWRTETMVVSPWLTTTIPAGAEIEVRITSLRYDFQVGGPTTIRLPNHS